jgi:hypothetical protein
LVNSADDSVNLFLAEGNSVKLFAADLQDRMYLSGTMFSLTATFADGSTAGTSVAIP